MLQLALTIGLKIQDASWVWVSFLSDSVRLGQKNARPKGMQKLLNPVDARTTKLKQKMDPTYRGFGPRLSPSLLQASSGVSCGLSSTSSSWLQTHRKVRSLCQNYGFKLKIPRKEHLQFLTVVLMLLCAFIHEETLNKKYFSLEFLDIQYIYSRNSPAFDFSISSSWRFVILVIFSVRHFIPWVILSVRAARSLLGTWVKTYKIFTNTTHA